MSARKAVETLHEAVDVGKAGCVKAAQAAGFLAQRLGRVAGFREAFSSSVQTREVGASIQVAVDRPGIARLGSATGVSAEGVDRGGGVPTGHATPGNVVPAEQGLVVVRTVTGNEGSANLVAEGGGFAVGAGQEADLCQGEYEVVVQNTVLGAVDGSRKQVGGLGELALLGKLCRRRPRPRWPLPR